MIVRDLLLGSDGDLVLSNGDLSLVSDTDAIRQAVRANLSFFKGEWFLDDSIGIPYFDEILIKSPKLGQILSIFKAAITGTKGIEELISVDLDTNRALRTLTINWKAKAAAGLLVDSVEVPI